MTVEYPQSIVFVTPLKNGAREGGDPFTLYEISLKLITNIL
jgi:hypothetical protein